MSPLPTPLNRQDTDWRRSQLRAGLRLLEGHVSPPAGSHGERVAKISFLAFAKRVALGSNIRIEAEFKPPPISFTVEDFDVKGRYIANRAALAKGSLSYEPPIPTFQSVDDAAQAKLRENARLNNAAARASREPMQPHDTSLKPPSNPLPAQGLSQPAPSPKIAPPPPGESAKARSMSPFASQELAAKQRDLVGVWPGFADLRGFKLQEYDAALATVPRSGGVTDVNKGIAIISAAMAKAITGDLATLIKFDDSQVTDLLNSQLFLYRAMESSLGEDFCGRVVENNLGSFGQPRFILSHFQQFLKLAIDRLNLQLKMIQAQATYKMAAARKAPTNTGLAPYTAQITSIQTFKRAKQYDKICGAVTDFLQTVIADADTNAKEARLTTLISIQ